MDIVEFNYNDDLENLKLIVKNSGSKSVKSSFSYIGFLNHYVPSKLKIFGIKDVGFLAIIVNRKWINIYEFCICQSEQRKGLGTLLMNYAIDFAKNKKLFKVKLRAVKDEPFYNFYLKYGFEIVGEKDNDYLFELNLIDEDRLI